MFARLKALALAAAVAGAFLVAPAHADYVFSGSGTSGNLFPGVEPWVFNADGGAAAGSPGNNWGSPGVNEGITAYSHADAAFGFDITFTGGGTILPGSVTIGNNAGCGGGTSGGTTFCTISPTNIWIATQTGASSLAFRAQDPSFFLTTGQSYFVNIFFAGETPTSFTGRWLTDFTPTPVPVPEPASMALFGAGLLGLGLARRRRRQQA
jgi:hypothetical protein